MTSITTPYVYTENGVDSAGDTAAEGGNFTFYGNAGGAQRGWFITFPTPIPNVTEVDFSTLSGTANNTTSSFSGTMRLRATTVESGDVTITTSNIPANGSINISTFPAITLSSETLTGVSILGRAQSNGANFSTPSITEGVDTYNITTTITLEATMFTHLADLTWSSIGGATSYTVTQTEDAGSEETIVSETTDLSFTSLNLNPGSSYVFNLYTDLDLVTPATSITESALVVDTANVTALAVRLSNDFSILSESSYDEVDSQLRNFLMTGDEVILSSGNAVFVEDSDTIVHSDTDILTPFESTAGSGQTITVTVGGESAVLTYNESLNEVTYDGTAYGIGESFAVGTSKVTISEI